MAEESDVSIGDDTEREEAHQRAEEVGAEVGEVLLHAEGVQRESAEHDLEKSTGSG